MADESIKNSSITIKEFAESMDIKYKGIRYTIRVGDKFGRLQVESLIKYVDNSGTSRKGCICGCECGEIIGPSRLYMLLSGDLISCGCYAREIHSEQLKTRNVRHGDNIRGQRTKLYTLWAGMIDRADNLNRPDAKYYAEKSIGVYEEWRDYIKFKEWAIKHGYVEGLSIERKDVNKGYYPDNCTFIPLSKQNLNKSNSRIIEYNGESKTLSQWCIERGISWSTLDTRLKSGWSIGKALGFEN